MTDQFLAEIRMFTGNFAPVGWATCDGQLMPISQNTALFSLIGTYYGGNGTSNFALPNLQGSIPLGMGAGPGLTQRVIGESGGETTVTLLSTEMPIHTHQVSAVAAPGTLVSPAGATWAQPRIGRAPEPEYAPTAGSQLSPQAFATSGGNVPHNNLPPYLVVTFIIALTGIFPARS